MNKTKSIKVIKVLLELVKWVDKVRIIAKSFQIWAKLIMVHFQPVCKLFTSNFWQSRWKNSINYIISWTIHSCSLKVQQNNFFCKIVFIPKKGSEHSEHNTGKLQTAFLTGILKKPGRILLSFTFANRKSWYFSADEMRADFFMNSDRKCSQIHQCREVPVPYVGCWLGI